MTRDEIADLDAWVRSTTSGHPGLEVPWRVVVPAGNRHADLVVREDPEAARRAGRTANASPIMLVPVSTSFYAAKDAIYQRIMGET